jgi:hypothetical protein
VPGVIQAVAEEEATDSAAALHGPVVSPPFAKDAKDGPPTVDVVHTGSGVER